MRKWKVLLMVVLAVSLALAFGYGRGRMAGAKGTTPAASNEVDWQKVIYTMPKQDLSEKEKESLIYMIQEEKLAHDVYTKLYEIWKLNTFLNISKSETTHVTAVKALLEKYGLENPIEGLKIGEFADEEFVKLYQQLIEQGSKSIADALKVGLLIEELDIYDLKKRIAQADNEDIKLVYGNLMKGSENHFRAFYSVLERYGETYTPKYITKEEMEEILSKTTGGSGNGRGHGKGRMGNR